MRLVSFNTGGGRGEDGRGDPGLLSAALTALDGDVLALQEVDRAQPRSEGMDQAAVAAAACGVEGSAHVRFEPTLWGTPGTPGATQEPGGPGSPSYGIALVSRWPVASWRRVDLPWARAALPVPAGPRRRGRPPTVYWLADEPRVGLAAVLAPPAPVATVVTAHLSFLPGVNAVQLRRLAAAVRDLPRPLVLLGDLNLPAAATRVLAPRWRGVRAPATFPAPDPRLCLDQVLLRDPWPGPTPAHTVRTGVSDHRALVVEPASAETLRPPRS